MHVLTNQTPLPFAYGETLQPGEWLLQDDHAFILAAQAPRGTVRVSPWVWNYPEGKTRRVVVRSGAIGDLLLASPAIQAFSFRYPETDISCLPRHRGLLSAIRTGFIEYPIPTSIARDYWVVMPLENVIEDATEKGIHATDAFAEALGVAVTDYKPVYAVTEEELAQQPCRTPGKSRVAIHLQSSSRIRDYPLKQWFQVISTLVARGWEVVLLGSNTPVKNLPLSVVDCSGKTFREAAAMLSTCDVFAGVDSSFFNLCPALGVPAIGLFGPVDWRTRVKEGSGQFALHGDGCEPCHWTSPRMGKPFPIGKPCTEKGCCVLLESIKPERVVAKIEAHAKR